MNNPLREPVLLNVTCTGATAEKHLTHIWLQFKEFIFCLPPSLSWQPDANWKWNESRATLQAGPRAREASPHPPLQPEQLWDPAANVAAASRVAADRTDQRHPAVRVQVTILSLRQKDDDIWTICKAIMQQTTAYICFWLSFTTNFNGFKSSKITISLPQVDILRHAYLSMIKSWLKIKKGLFGFSESDKTDALGKYLWWFLKGE